jgi:putative addiction module component (TIGR02574 family)
MNKPLLAELLQLSPAERIQLAEDLWDSVAAMPEAIPPLTEVQRAEIDRRLAAYTESPASALPWDDVRAKLWLRLG